MIDAAQLRARVGKKVTLRLSDRCDIRELDGKLSRVSVTGTIAWVGRTEVPVEEIVEADFGHPLGVLR